jgi:hypothetical protein
LCDLAPDPVVTRTNINELRCCAGVLQFKVDGSKKIVGLFYFFSGSKVFVIGMALG